MISLTCSSSFVVTTSSESKSSGLESFLLTVFSALNIFVALFFSQSPLLLLRSQQFFLRSVLREEGLVFSLYNVPSSMRLAGLTFELISTFNCVPQIASQFLDYHFSFCFLRFLGFVLLHCDWILQCDPICLALSLVVWFSCFHLEQSSIDFLIWGSLSFAKSILFFTVCSLGNCYMVLNINNL